MLKIKGILCKIAPILAILLLLTANSEASTQLKTKHINFNEQNQNNSKIINRQDNLFDYLDNLNLLKNTNQYLITQINSVKQLRDIHPTDWSYQALQNLIERYGCISGFDDHTYRGTETLSRAEFAAGLNSCLNSIEKTIAQTKNVPQADIDTVLRLMQEFQSELAILQGRTDGSQARLEDLEATQFSATTKLQGEAVFGLGSVLAGDEDDTNSIFGSRLRLDLLTSFQGNDLLFTRLSQGNFAGFAPEIDTFQGDLAFAEPDDSDFRLEDLHYSFTIGDRLGWRWWLRRCLPIWDKKSALLSPW